LTCKYKWFTLTQDLHSVSMAIDIYTHNTGSTSLECNTVHLVFEKALSAVLKYWTPVRPGCPVVFLRSWVRCSNLKLLGSFVFKILNEIIISVLGSSLNFLRTFSSSLLKLWKSRNLQFWFFEIFWELTCIWDHIFDDNDKNYVN
jgi:hypothetical protein